jgi:WD40 repeat protein
LSGHRSRVLSVSFDREGLFASGSADNTIKLWNTKSGECLRTLSGHGSRVWSVSFDGDGLLASGSWDNMIKLWNTKTGECVRISNVSWLL